jgi:threonine/homoserine/homoserine lactone efflux protein
MWLSYFIFSVAGFLAGFVLSMPIVGPIGILITSNALRGRLRFCTRTALGAAISEFFYVFIVVYGVSALFSFYEPFIPYLLIIGTIVLLVTGVKIISTKLDLSHVDENGIVSDKLKNKGGLRTGLLINLTNPSVMFSWLITSFLILSSLSSLGLSTSGFDKQLRATVKEFEKMDESTSLDTVRTRVQPEVESAETGENISNLSKLSLSATFAMAVSLGSLVYLSSYARFLVKHRAKLNLTILSGIIKSLGCALIMLGIFMGYKAVKFFL